MPHTTEQQLNDAETRLFEYRTHLGSHTLSLSAGAREDIIMDWKADAELAKIGRSERGKIFVSSGLTTLSCKHGGFTFKDQISDSLQADGAQSISLHPLHPFHPNFRHLRNNLRESVQLANTVSGMTTTTAPHAVTLERKAAASVDQDFVRSGNHPSSAVDGVSKRCKSARMGTGGNRPRKLN